MVKINKKALDNSDGKMMVLITETWQGMPATAGYVEQDGAISRALDSVEYIERAIDRGDVLMAHKKDNKVSTTHLLGVDELEQLNSYIKSNEAHARLPKDNREVLALSDWDASLRDFDVMISRAEIRARYDLEGRPQPSQDDLDGEAANLVKERQSVRKNLQK